MKYIVIVISLLLSACNSISDAELSGLENTIKNSISSSGSFKFEASKVSSGKIGEKSFQLVQVRYTAATPHPRQCAYVLYHYDKEAGLLTNQTVGMSNMMDGGCTVTDGCFGCNGRSFLDVVKERGYTGKIEDL